MVLPISTDARAPSPGSLPAVISGSNWRYRVPVRVAGPLVWSTATGRRRSFAVDARRAVRGSPYLVLGAEHIPARGACLVLCNHYTRPGLGAWWIALSVTGVVAAHRASDAPAEMPWVMTAGWRFPKGDWRHRVITPLTRWAFARVALTYGFVTMPPMPPDPNEVGERTLAVLHTVRLAQRLATEGGLLGLVPEGRDTGRLLGEPPEGVGDFVALLVATGMPVLPVGISEEERRLRLSFGAPFVPAIPPRHAGRDRAVIDQVMAAIAAQLPGNNTEPGSCYYNG